MLYRAIEERGDSEHIFIIQFLKTAERRKRGFIWRFPLLNHSSGPITKEKAVLVMCSLLIHYNIRTLLSSEVGLTAVPEVAMYKRGFIHTAYN